MRWQIGSFDGSECSGHFILAEISLPFWLDLTLDTTISDPPPERQAGHPWVLMSLPALCSDVRQGWSFRHTSHLCPTFFFITYLDLPYVIQFLFWQNFETILHLSSYSLQWPFSEPLIFRLTDKSLRNYSFFILRKFNLRTSSKMRAIILSLNFWGEFLF